MWTGKWNSVICEERKQCATIQHVPDRGTIAFEFLTHAIFICRFIIVVDASKHARNMLNKIENYEWIEWQIMHLITYRHSWTNLSLRGLHAVTYGCGRPFRRSMLIASAIFSVDMLKERALVPWLCKSTLNAMSTINRQFGGWYF